MVALSQTWKLATQQPPSAQITRQTPLHCEPSSATPIRMVLRARFYDPSTAEFISPDPLEYVDGMSLFRGYFVLRSIDPHGMRMDTEWGIYPDDFMGPLPPGCFRDKDAWVSCSPKFVNDYDRDKPTFERCVKDFRGLGARLASLCPDSCSCCTKEDCEREAFEIGQDVLQAWIDWFGVDQGIPGRPIKIGTESDAQCGGYLCYGWARIFANQVKKKKCFSAKEMGIFYTGIPIFPAAGGDVKVKIHAYTEIQHCSSPKSALRLDDGFTPARGCVHDTTWPASVYGNKPTYPYDPKTKVKCKRDDGFDFEIPFPNQTPIE